MILSNENRDQAISQILDKANKQQHLLSDFHKEIIDGSLSQDVTKYSFVKFCALVLELHFLHNFCHTLRNQHFPKILKSCSKISQNVKSLWIVRGIINFKIIKLEFYAEIIIYALKIKERNITEENITDDSWNLSM